MDREVSGDRRVARGERFEDLPRETPRKARTPGLFAHADAAESQLAGAAQNVAGEVLRGIPFQGVGGQLGRGELADGVEDGGAVVSGQGVERGGGGGVHAALLRRRQHRRESDFRWTSK